MTGALGLGGDTAMDAGEMRAEDEAEVERYHRVSFPEHWARYLIESLPSSLDDAQATLA